MTGSHAPANPPGLSDFVELLPFPAFIAAVPSGRLLHWNAAAQARCGGALATATLPQLLGPRAGRTRAEGPARVEEALRDGSVLVDVDAVLGPAALPVAISVQPIARGGMNPDAALVLCHPTGRWMETAGALHRNEERLAVALGAARLGSWEFDLRTRRLTSTTQCKANHGFGPDDDMQLEPDILETISPDHRTRFVGAIDRAVATAGSFDIEVPNRWPDGTSHWLMVAGRMIDETSMVGVSQDITERRRTQEALRESEAQYRALVETANEGIWRLDQEARIVFVNRRMADLLQVTPAAMAGRHKWDFVFDEDVPAMRELFEHRKQGLSEEVADIRFRRADGREVWMLMAARPLYDADGRFTGAVDLFTDITERRRAEQALRDAGRRKDEFLAVLAHELRGPLAPIITAVKLLQAKAPPDPVLQRLHDTIYRQTLQLRTLVDDLLDVGRITAGKLRLEKAPVDLRVVVQQAVEVSQTLVERRRHALQVDLPPMPVMVDADAPRLVQVAGNLLNNAAKFTPEGGRIGIHLHEEDGAGVVRVRDEGVGIPPEMIERIFDRFVQAGGADEGEGGLGIGLSVVKALVELHGGRVEARSEGPGRGSEFTFRLPLGTTSPAP